MWRESRSNLLICRSRAKRCTLFADTRSEFSSRHFCFPVSRQLDQAKYQYKNPEEKQKDANERKLNVCGSYRPYSGILIELNRQQDSNYQSKDPDDAQDDRNYPTADQGLC
jgi:hypothetical protein